MERRRMNRFWIPKISRGKIWNEKQLENFRKNWPHLKNFENSVLENATLSELTAMGKQKVSNSRLLSHTLSTNLEHLQNFPEKIEGGGGGRLFGEHPFCQILERLCWGFARALAASQAGLGGGRDRASGELRGGILGDRGPINAQGLGRASQTQFPATVHKTSVTQIRGRILETGRQVRLPEGVRKLEQIQDPHRLS
jgi:hypothetical protein